MNEVLEAIELRDCILGYCQENHDGLCYFNVFEDYASRVDRANKAIYIATLKARVDEAQGFDHGGEEWTNNGQKPNGEALSAYERQIQLEAEIGRLQNEIDSLIYEN